MEYTNATPKEVRHLFRNDVLCQPTTGMCNGYAQANLVILPRDLAYDFLLFTQRNPRSCPVLEVSDTGSRSLKQIAHDVDLARDFPRYRIYEHGVLTGECKEIESFWRDDFVSFLIGCSFSFESDLIEAGIPVRQIEENVNVPMYNTNISCTPAGIFSGNMVVSMRPIPYGQVVQATTITAAMPKVHGAPIHIGDPLLLGIKNLDAPDFGDAVTIKPGEVPVFWPCGVTPQAVVMNTKPDFAITHAPGHMLITDIKNINLK
ncbi:putative hydro-lyase [Lachnospiraceae bacterium ZAX-1]